jgi:m7GpppX diphosphatase
MELTEGQINHKFIPTSVLSFLDIQTLSNQTNLIFKNDVFEKYEVITEVKGEYILCSDIRKLKKHSKILVKESYNEYLDFIKVRDIENDRWIYNIIDGLFEQDKLIYKDETILIIPTFTWDSNNIDKLHILCLPTNKSIRTIRDLSSKDIPLLIYMKNITLKQIKEKYDINNEQLKIFLHYDPSTYHLHIHFINTEHTESFSSVEYSHDLDSVIFNLNLDSDYYKKIKLNRRI